MRTAAPDARYRDGVAHGFHLHCSGLKRFSHRFSKLCTLTTTLLVARVPRIETTEVTATVPIHRVTNTFLPMQHPLTIRTYT